MRIPACGDGSSRDVSCDEAFYDAIKVATGSVQRLMEVTLQAKEFQLQSSKRLRSAVSVEESVTAGTNIEESVTARAATSSRVILIANLTRANAAGRLRIGKIETEFDVRVITVRVCKTLGGVDDDGNLVHISADFKTVDGMKEISRLLSKHKVPTPWAIILDHAGFEPIAYGSKYVACSLFNCHGRNI